MTPGSNTDALLEHLFRHQAGRMVGHFARLFGPAHLDAAEEAVQEALLRAVQTWPYSGAPDNPAAWLYRVAHNAAIDAIRRRRLFAAKAETLVAELSEAAAQNPEDADLDERLRDDELRMIFMCCHPEIPREARIALSLKTVGGFSVREIARAFLADEAAIAQRLVRAKRQIRDRNLTLEMPRGAELEERLDAALDVIYLMFNEGYAAHEGEDLIRQDLCYEALRLGQSIAASSMSRPRVHALVALLALQAARLPARVNEEGDLILLDSQDRSRWDRRLMAVGFYHFDRSIGGDSVSRYHVEAAIAATHARAPDAQSTDWRVILELYDELLALSASPVVALNRTVAMAKVHGAGRALRELTVLERERRLQDYYLVLAVRGHLLMELGRNREAAECFRAALQCRCSEPEKRFLKKKLEIAASVQA